MSQFVAYFNGRFVPFAEVRLPAWDYGLVQGATVTDMVRTFAGEPFRLDAHLRRFAASCGALAIELPETLAMLAECVRQVIRETVSLLPEGCDFGVLMFATPGPYEGYARFGRPPGEMGRSPDQPSRPTLCVHPFPLAYSKFAPGYRDGISLATPATRHIPPEIIPPQLKYRSRLHWYLAEREAHRIDSSSGALLLDADGCVTETNSGNLFCVFDDALLTPRAGTTLGGVSQSFVMELARASGITVERADLTPEFLLRSQEVFLSSTTYCLLPVTRLDRQPIGNGAPGQLCRQLLAQWSAAVGLDIAAQAQQFAALP